MWCSRVCCANDVERTWTNCPTSAQSYCRSLCVPSNLSLNDVAVRYGAAVSACHVSEIVTRSRQALLRVRRPAPDGSWLWLGLGTGYQDCRAAELSAWPRESCVVQLETHMAKRTAEHVLLLTFGLPATMSGSARHACGTAAGTASLIYQHVHQ